MSRPAIVERLLTHEVSMSASPSDIAQLRAYIESLERDAARYRWLRERPEPLGYMQTAIALGLDLSRTSLDAPEKLDAALDAAIAQEARHIDVLRAERDHARACFVKVSAVLTSIHSLLYPAPIALEDGRTMVFRPSDPDPHAVLQALSDRIRAIPDDVGSGAQEAADREDAERWCLAVEKLGTLRAFLAGWRGTESCRRNGLESTVDEWDAGLAALGGLYIAARAKEKSNV